MSDLVINVRFGLYHFQVARGRPRFSITRNDFHRRGRSPWFAIYAPFQMSIGGHD